MGLGRHTTLVKHPGGGEGWISEGSTLGLETINPKS